MAQSTRRRRKVARVMREHKRGALKSGRSGRKVKSRKQAIAIAMSESGQSRNKSKRKKSARKTSRKKASRKSKR
ncbi:MAG: hypothetical protein JO021_18155 [Alphaproteobacteria bacterium]|nr:hypothetical protein [Alphaproteobacteria bacterium]